MTDLVPLTTITYSSNNSGGSWWLSDDDWRNLEAAGWNVEWVVDQDHQYSRPDADGRWLGALATCASRTGLSMGEAIAEWEGVTGLSSNAVGCNCCGAPHSFSSDDGEYYAPDIPLYGNAYSY